MRFTEPVFRAHNPHWAWTLVSGTGAGKHGGRFNRKGVAALYTSLSELTAIREASLWGRPMQPLTLCQYEVDCHRIFDSADPAQLALEDISMEDLAAPDWEQEMLEGLSPASHVVADHLIARGYCGMIVRSFARGSTADDLNAVF